MAFSRIRYDDCSTKLYTTRSVGEGDYRLFGGFNENCSSCVSTTGPIGSKVDVSTPKYNPQTEWGEMAHIESELLNLNIPLNRCNENATNTHYDKNKVINKNVCSPFLNAEDSRFTYPVQAFRSMSLTSYQLQPFLYSNPQCNIIDDRTGSNTRNNVKDNYVQQMVVPIADCVLPYPTEQ